MSGALIHMPTILASHPYINIFLPDREPPMYPSISLPPSICHHLSAICPSIHLLSVSLPLIHLSTHFIHPSIQHPFIHLPFTHPSPSISVIHLSICHLFNHQSIPLSTYLPAIHLSIHPSSQILNTCSESGMRSLH